MTTAANIAIGFVALLHAYFLVLEMFLWDTPFGRRVFKIDAGIRRRVEDAGGEPGPLQRLPRGRPGLGAGAGRRGRAREGLLPRLRHHRRRVRRRDGEPQHPLRAGDSRASWRSRCCWADMGNRLSKIATRTGDKGETGLGDGSARGEGFRPHPGAGRHRRAEFEHRRAARREDAGGAARGAAADPARPVRPRRRNLHSRPQHDHRGARAQLDALLADATTASCRRSRNSSCRAARAPPRSRTWRAPCAGAPNAAWSRSAAPNRSASARAST